MHQRKSLALLIILVGGGLVWLVYYLCSACPPCEFTALPRQVAHSPAAARLGAALFHEKHLVRSQWVTCGKCHPNFAGTTLRDGRRSCGVNNIAFANVFGRAGAVTNLHQMVHTMITASEYGDAPELTEIEKWLRRDEPFAKRFTAVYPSGFTMENLTDALANFLLTRITPPTRFDQWCNGNTNALTVAEKRGADEFRAKCMRCHNEPALGARKVVKGVKVPQLRGFERLKLVAPADHPEQSENLQAFLKTL